MTARQLTDLELEQIASEMDSLNIRIKQGSISLEEAEQIVTERRQVMVDTLDRSLEKQPANRVKAWEKVNDLQGNLRERRFELEREAGPKFKATDFLSIEADKDVNAVKRVISGITLNGRKKLSKEELRYNDNKDETTVSDEKYARIRIAMLNDFGKYIDKDHPELKKLKQRYMDKTITNYMEYAKSAFRNPRRDRELYAKIKEANDSGKYSDSSFALAVLNLLQPVVPQQDESNGTEN